MKPWLAEHAVEMAGVIFSLLYLYFSIRQKVLLWPMGIVSAILYMVVFYQSKFYADMGLNGYYVVVSIYGWILWGRGKEKGSSAELRVTRLKWRNGLLLMVITLIAFILIGQLLERYTDSPIPYWDALPTAMSFTATWMLARKILEHWILWVVVDLLSMGLYAYRGLIPTLVLFAIYTTMAVIGYIQWKKDMNT
jgi:nicotinamide mononucleotide transporter